MDIERIEEMAALMEKYGLTKVTLDEGESKLTLAKEVSAMQVPIQTPVTYTHPSSIPPVQELEEPVQNLTAMGEELTSPLVGIAYVAANPNAKPYVSIGDQVKKGQTLCIIESMKVMNEFPAPRDGEISDISITDGSLVEFGQVLFRLK